MGHGAEERSDVGNTAVWLVSDLAAWGGVTGETIDVDCGINILGGKDRLLNGLPNTYAQFGGEPPMSLS